MNIIFNADDLGFSPGVNAGINTAFDKGILNSASLMANGRYYDQAIDIISNHTKFAIGAHIVLTTGKSLTSPASITENGIFNKTYVQLLLMRKSKNILKEIEKEIEAQILKIKNSGIIVCHIDGHEHIHTIPSIKKLVIKLATKYAIPRIREINENPIYTINSSIKKIPAVNYLKFLLIKFLYFFQEKTNSIEFYSILHTGNIHPANLNKFLKKYSKEFTGLEVMLHPSIIELDLQENFDNPRTKKFLLSADRTMELETCLKNFK